MFTSEQVLSESAARFRRLALDAGIRHKLSASRDLFAKAIFGVAYSQSMARARAGALNSMALDHDQIVHARDFGATPEVLLRVLGRSVSALNRVKVSVE